jgi:hypothetical protein
LETTEGLLTDYLPSKAPRPAGVHRSYEIWDLARFHRMVTSGALSEWMVGSNPADVARTTSFLRGQFRRAGRSEGAPPGHPHTHQEPAQRDWQTRLEDGTERRDHILRRQITIN